MPRTCTVCSHSEREAIDASLVQGEAFRNIAQRFGTSATALFRHKNDCLPASLVKAREAQEVAAADNVLAQLKNLQQTTLRILRKAEKSGRLGTAVMAIREARGNLELLAELAQLLDRRPEVNIMLMPEWLQIRSIILVALAPYPEAKAAVAERLVALEAGRDSE